MTEWHCGNCGANTVETLMLVWVARNDEVSNVDLEDRVDGEASAYPNIHWCWTCRQHPEKLKEVVVNG